MKVAKLEETVLLQYKWMEYLAYLLVFITPLYFSTSHWFPFNHPKTLTISAGVLLMTILFAWGAVVSKDFFLRINPLHIVLGFFVLILTLSSILGVDPHNSFF